MQGFRRAFAAEQDPFTTTITLRLLVEISSWDNITTAQASCKVMAHCHELYKEHSYAGAMERAVQKVLQGLSTTQTRRGPQEGEGSEEAASVAGSD